MRGLSDIIKDLQRERDEIINLLTILSGYPTDSHFAHSITPQDMEQVKEMLAKLKGETE